MSTIYKCPVCGDRAVSWDMRARIFICHMHNCNAWFNPPKPKPSPHYPDDVEKVATAISVGNYIVGQDYFDNYFDKDYLTWIQASKSGVIDPNKPRGRGPFDEEFERGYVPVDAPPGIEEHEYRRWKEAGGKVNPTVSRAPLVPHDGTAGEYYTVILSPDNTIEVSTGTFDEMLVFAASKGGPFGISMKSACDALLACGFMYLTDTRLRKTIFFGLTS